jgi:glucose-1-phosphate cytidylyltransferase
VNLKSLVDFFVEQKSLGVITAVNPPTRFGALKIRDGKVFYFGEKPNDENTWINGGFFVLNRKIASFIEDDNDLFETGALPKLAEMGELSAFKHHGFWKPMDTLREKRELDQFAQQAIPPWLANII